MLAVSLGYAVSLGLHYGIANQNSYLIRPLHMYDPSLLANDWVTTQVTSHHPCFEIVAAGLYHLSPEGRAFAYANVLCAALLAVVVYRLLRTFDERWVAVTAWVMLLAVMRFTGTSSVSGSYIIRGYLQPSTIGALGFLAAILFFVRGKYAFSGLALGLGGLLHSNYLVLGFPVFLAAHVLLGRQRLLHRLTAQFAVPTLALAYFLPSMLEVALEGSTFNDLRETFLLIRSPHHYDPANFKRQFVPFLCWLAIGGGALRIYTSRERMSAPLRAAVALVVSCLGLMAIGTLLTSLVYVAKVAQLQPWRVAPFVELLCQGVFCLVVARELAQSRVEARSRFGLGLMTVGLAGLLFKTRMHWFGPLVWIGPLVLLAPVAWGLFRFKIARRAVEKVGRPFVAAAVGIVVLVSATAGNWLILSNSEFFGGHAHRPDYDELFRWAELYSPRDAIFVTPPNLDRFRLHARRAIVVDWKTPPARGAEVATWFERLKDVSGVEHIRGIRQISQGYNQMTPQRLSKLHEKYAAEYAVLEAARCDPRVRSSFPVLFENDTFLVVPTRSVSERSRLADAERDTPKPTVTRR